MLTFCMLNQASRLTPQAYIHQEGEPVGDGHRLLTGRDSYEFVDRAHRLPLFK